ncbi:DUF808 family protein [Hippea maritima]|uniref:DUF808 domain-containing protein n=1 Tax=Hippea maritima (strain ATCC 700847 / DSM 10411 / MH2) TaxID=760142 RepID=F2LVL8_HIPMA|nr:DUF808 family protein [Hippea maritima]AEA33802.1 protein of unknown function DUF808 [Hippea maritima DSM 10411]
MASGFFALLDDISTLMDDIASATKIATKNTVSLLGDDVAVNAKKASGFDSSKEIPILIAIIKGSLINKAILLPIVFILEILAEWLIVPILLLGGIYISYEAFEKVYEFVFTKKHKKEQNKELTDKEKIRSAIKTDFILSIEIVVMAISSVLGKPLYIQIPTVAVVSVVATAGVYGFVALIVRMDDIGIKLIQLSDKKGRFLRSIGIALIEAMPYVVKILSVVGTLAMFLVCGGIYMHKLEFIHHLLDMFEINIPILIIEMMVGFIVGGFSFMIKEGLVKFAGLILKS